MMRKLSIINKDGGTDGLLASSRPTTAAALRALSPGCIAAWFVAVVTAGSENQWTSPSTKWEDLAPLIFVKLRKRRHRPRSSRSGHHTLLTDSLVPGRTSTAARQKRGARPSSTPRAARTHTLTDRPSDSRQPTPKTKRQKFARSADPGDDGVQDYKQLTQKTPFGLLHP